MPISGEGAIPVTVTAANTCSDDACSFNVNVDVNNPPIVVDGLDTTITQCALTEICLPFGVIDDEGDIVEIRTSLGVISDGQVCFTPSAFADYAIVITAIDSCGAVDDDTISVSVVQGQFVAIQCPEGTIPVAVDVPDTVRIPIAIDGADDAEIDVTPFGYYDVGNGALVAYIEGTGVYDFRIVAEAECNTDTCDVQLDVRQYVPPTVECIGSVDTALCLVAPDTLCLPVTILGSNVQVEVSAPGYYSAPDLVCIPVEEPGEYSVVITAFNDRDTARCTSSRRGYRRPAPGPDHAG